jgi:multidrug efflux pump subunit AcrB
MSLKGRTEDQSSTFNDLLSGALLALLLIYLILVWVFSSYSWPIAVMAILPFGITGAIIGHFVMQLDLTILSIFWNFWAIWYISQQLYYSSYFL